MIENTGFALTPSQLAIWNTEELIGGSAVILAGSILYEIESNRPDAAAMKGYVRELYRVNDALRVRIFFDGTKWVQYFSDLDFEIPDQFFETEEAFHIWAAENAKQPLDRQGLLCKIWAVSMPNRYGLFVKIHHVIADAWSLGLLGSQMNELLQGRTDIQAGSFLSYLLKEESYLKSGRYQKDLRFFKEDYCTKSDLPAVSIKQADDYQASRATFEMTLEHVNMLRSLAERENVSLFSVIMAIFAVYTMGTQWELTDYYLGTTLLNRFGEIDRSTVGMFVKTLPVPLHLTGEESMPSVFSYIQNQLTAVMRHSRCTYGDILKEIRKDFKDQGHLFDISINLINTKVAGDQPFTTTWYPSGMQTEALTVQIEDIDDCGTARFHYDYRRACFTQEQLTKLHQRFCSILAEVQANPQISLKDINLITEHEKEAQLGRTMPQKSKYIPCNLGRWFKQTVQEHPDNCAVETMSHCYTYRQLMDMIDSSICGLKVLGVKPGSVVALQLSRDVQLPVMMMAVISLGAAFLLVDPGLPQARIRYMLSAGNVSVMIDDEKASELIHAKKDAAIGSLPEKNYSEELCYIIYTSGSTGAPKGVMVRQRNLINNLLWRLDAYPQRNHRIICVTGVGADTFLEDVFFALYSGNTLCLVQENRNLLEIAKMIERGAPNDLMVTPTFFGALQKEIRQSQLHSVTFVGEQLDSHMVAELCRNGVVVHNEYGPSECTICATHAVLNNGDIHIGRPIAGTSAYILDSHQRLMPDGCIGELCLEGAHVGAGYLGMPEMTAARFIQGFHANERLYRTGDLAYLRADGNLCLVGRCDDQVKIRGLRVELGEIASCMAAVPGIDQAAVIVRRDTEGRQYLCAFYTGNKQNAEKLRETLGERLPKHMIPHFFTQMDSMPLSQNGKIDKKKLPDINLRQMCEDVGYVAPETKEEKILCHIAGTLLEINPYGMEQNFFACGGDSLKAIEFVTLAWHEGIIIPVQLFYEHPTMRSLTNALQEIDCQDKKAGTVSEDTQFSELLKQNTQSVSEIKERKVSGLLLTGATGFLGVHLLAEYLKQSSEQVWCIVRGEAAEERLISKLRFYFGDQYVGHIRNRIHIVKGDLSKPMLDLSEPDYNALRRKIHTVVHAAANVRHYGDYAELFRDNVQSVDELIRFCKESEIRLFHCSTTSVIGSGDNLSSEKGTVFYESSLNVGQNLDHVYIRSKYEAERHILEAIKDGLHGCILRVGNLMGRFSDGHFQQNADTNAFMKQIAAITQMRCVPEDLLTIPIDFSPVDLTAKAILKIVSIEGLQRTVCHVCSPHRVNLKKLAQALQDNGFCIESVAAETFAKRLIAASPETAGAFVGLLDARNHLHLPDASTVDASATVDLLKMAHFIWPENSREYLCRCIKYLKQNGILEESE